MKLTSPAFGHNQDIPSKFTCDGENVNPPLSFLDIPENTKSLVLIVDDPDAQAKIWIHWTVLISTQQFPKLQKIVCRKVGLRE